MFKDTPRLLVILKASQVCNAYAIKEFITNPTNVSLGQNKRTKSALYLLSRCSWAEAQGFVSQTMCGIFYFCFHFVFTRFYFFFQQKARTLWLSNVTIPSKIKIIKKSKHSLAPRSLSFKLQQKVLKFSNMWVDIKMKRIRNEKSHARF